MTGRDSRFPTALRVSPDRIRTLSESELNILMDRLFKAQGYRCGADISQIAVNTEQKAKDDGCDGWTPKPSSKDPWLGDEETCWQLKSGTAGRPAKLKGEIKKPIPSQTLRDGGGFVVVASGSGSGRKGVLARLKVLCSEAQELSLPTEKIKVLCSEQIANWCNQHPAIAADCAGMPSGLWALEDWERSEEHNVPWSPTPTRQSEIDSLKKDLDHVSGTVVHVHIQGQPGVGKTRFALELCKAAPWSSNVIYIRQATDIRLLELIDGAVSDMGVRLTVVVDEVQEKDLQPLTESVRRGNGRIRLITIGHCTTPDPQRIPSIIISPLDQHTMTEIVRAWYPSMPLEHKLFVARFADGYVRLGRLAADAVMGDPSLDVQGLLNLDQIRKILDGMLGEGDRRYLYVVAVLESVGWTEERESEGKAVAEHFGLDWRIVKYKVDEFQRKFGIVPRGGRLRYISPEPLGNYLALEAWNTFPDELKSLPDVLPSIEAQDSYYGRLRMLMSNPQARDFAREELQFFFHLEHFYDPHSVRRWAVLASADPSLAAHNVRQALEGSSHEQRSSITGEARRQLVWGLVRLAWRSEAFHDATISLAFLAEAENESWANNATSEFFEKFRILLSGTAVPYPNRLPVLDEILQYRGETFVRLVITALIQVGITHAARNVLMPLSEGPPEPEWRPQNQQETLHCAQLSLERLLRLLKDERSLPVEALIKAAEELSMLLRVKLLQPLVVDFFLTIFERYPETREILRRFVSDILYREQKYWKQLPSDDIEKIKALHSRLEDPSLGGRLRQIVGEAGLDPTEQPDMRDLAGELLNNQNILASEWSWLTSGEASGAWQLGQTFSFLDVEGNLADRLANLPNRGRDIRIISGYLEASAKRLGSEWLDDWIERYLRSHPDDSQLALEVLWRCGGTPRRASLIAEIISSKEVSPELVGHLAFGQWWANLSRDSVREVVSALISRPYLKPTALAVLFHRLKLYPEEESFWESFAINLVTTPELIRSVQMTNFFWKGIADKIVKRYSREIARAIFHEQANRARETWFVQHSEAKGVLFKCVVTDPGGVWEELRPYLENHEVLSLFRIGFPTQVLDQIPVETILRWLEEDSNNRATAIASMISVNLSSDKTLAAKIIGNHGDNKAVASTFYSAYLSGGWAGSVSEHWSRLAAELEAVAKRTSLPKLRFWAQNGVRSLESMSERERQREEEDKLRFGF